jgi:glycosyltransferase involved in cell wall biosynthesis
MAAAIARLRDDPALRERLVANARKTLDMRFSKKAVIDLYLETFDKLSGART